MSAQGWQYTSHASVSTRSIAKRFRCLSPRQAEVCCLVAGRLSTAEIAQCLAISQRTVEKHLENIFEKLKVQSRKQLRKRLGVRSPVTNLTLTLANGDALRPGERSTLSSPARIFR